MFPSSLQQLITFPKVKATPENVKETLEWLGMDFSNFPKFKACRNSEDGNKVATISVEQV